MGAAEMSRPATLSVARAVLVHALWKRGAGATEGLSKYDVQCATKESVFKLSFMPGNRRTLISHAVEVFLEARGKGVGTKLNELREEAAREAGVTLMLATVRDDNTAEIRVLEKCGWTRFTQNHETHCSLWGKQLCNNSI
jgi:GNAT superfamily N-acetyltransferase